MNSEILKFFTQEEERDEERAGAAYAPPEIYSPSQHPPHPIGTVGGISGSPVVMRPLKTKKKSIGFGVRGEHYKGKIINQLLALT